MLTCDITFTLFSHLVWKWLQCGSVIGLVGLVLLVGSVLELWLRLLCWFGWPVTDSEWRRMDVVILSSASAYTAFFTSSGRGYGLTICHLSCKLWLEASKGILSVKWSSLVVIKCHQDGNIATMLRWIWPPSCLAMLPYLRKWSLMCENYGGDVRKDEKWDCLNNTTRLPCVSACCHCASRESFLGV